MNGQHAASEPLPNAHSIIKAPADSTIDPVCGMTVTRAANKPTREHEGKSYFFCSDRCAKTFDSDPEAYLAPQSDGRSPDHNDSNRSSNWAMISSASSRLIDCDTSGDESAANLSASILAG